MKDEKDLKKVNEEGQDVEGYDYCDTTRERCLNDCIGGGPVLSSVN